MTILIPMCLRVLCIKEPLQRLLQLLRNHTALFFAKAGIKRELVKWDTITN